MFIFGFLSWKVSSSFHSFLLLWNRHWNDSKVGNSLLQLVLIIWDDLLVWDRGISESVRLSLRDWNNSVARNWSLMFYSVRIEF